MEGFPVCSTEQKNDAQFFQRALCALRLRCALTVTWLRGIKVIASSQQRFHPTTKEHVSDC